MIEGRHHHRLPAAPLPPFEHKFERVARTTHAGREQERDTEWDFHCVLLLLLLFAAFFVRAWVRARRPPANLESDAKLRDRTQACEGASERERVFPVNCMHKWTTHTHPGVGRGASTHMRALVP